MKYTHLCALSLGLALFACSKPQPSTASPTPTPVVNVPGENLSPAARQERRQQRLAKMQADLGLTDEQTAKVTALFESQRPAMEALRNDQTLTREQKREKIRALRETMEGQLTTIFTPEQKAKWETIRSQWQTNHPDAAASPAAQ